MTPLRRGFLLHGINGCTEQLPGLTQTESMPRPASVDHDELLELAAQDLADLIHEIEQRGTCTVCLAALLLMVAQGTRDKPPRV